MVAQHTDLQGVTFASRPILAQRARQRRKVEPMA
jgi:hypothetical protein